MAMAPRWEIEMIEAGLENNRGYEKTIVSIFVSSRWHYFLEQSPIEINHFPTSPSCIFHFGRPSRTTPVPINTNIHTITTINNNFLPLALLQTPFPPPLKLSHHQQFFISIFYRRSRILNFPTWRE